MIEEKMNLYQKITGKKSLLANSTRLDLWYLAMQMSKKNQGATIANLRDVNCILKKVRERESRVKYEYIRDASFKQDDKAIGGIFLFLANLSMTHAAPIFWKTKQIDRVCHSSKDTETLNLLKMVDDSVLAA